MKIGDIVRINQTYSPRGGHQEMWIIRKIEGDEITVGLQRSPVVKQKLLYWKLLDKEGKKPRKVLGALTWAER